MASIREKIAGSIILMHHLGLVWRTAILAGLLVVGWGCADGFAQGSAGGTVAKENKSVSGSEGSEPERAARRNRPEPRARRAPPREGGGSISRFDGRWIFIASGCSKGTQRGVISGGSISGLWGGAGRVDAGGAMRASFTVWGIATVAVGHLSGNRGAGTISRVDGCTDSWTAIKY